ncbi:monocyte chemotactic protein 1B-like [Pagrus major]|uniref:monocyte chemotactic protein 1B-like n=1 Tax=Pagrus major TaxID=143350 RepID=UPI003CC8A4E9
MSTRILSIALLLLFVCSAYTSPNKRYPSRRFPHPCCPSLSSANISNDVIGNTYRQIPVKPGCVEAVILKTHHGEVCVDPKSEWVQNLTANMTKV